MTGSVPPYVYRVNYPEIEVATVLYDFNSKTITLAAIKQDAETGAVSLRFSATNNSEAADFVPVVEVKGARVSSEGMVFDGADDTALGWTSPSTDVKGDKLAPGKTGDFVLTLPRVVGDGFKLLELRPEFPDAVLLELSATDALTEAGTQVAEPALVAFERSPNEQRFWLADLAVTGIQWEPTVPTIGRDVKVTITIENRGRFPADKPAMVLQAGSEDVGNATLGTMDPGASITKQFTWRAKEGLSTFTAVIDPQDQILEGDESNNQTTVNFGGAFLPDLVVASITWEPTDPSIGDTVTFTVIVKNQGKGRAGGSDVEYYLDGSTFQYKQTSLGSIAAGETAIGKFTWSARPGEHSWRVVADDDRDVLESDETNNEKVVTYTGTLTKQPPPGPTPGGAVAHPCSWWTRGRGELPVPRSPYTELCQGQNRKALALREQISYCPFGITLLPEGGCRNPLEGV